MRILHLSRYDRLGASSRVRSFQFIPYLEQAGLAVTVSPLLGDDYLLNLYAGRRPRARQILASYANRWVKLLESRNYDVVWVEKELFPWLPAWGEALLNLSGVPYVVDYDDAVFHRYDQHRSRWVRLGLGRKIDAVMHRSALVLAGNDYLAERAQAAGAARVEIVPTVVDLERYHVVPTPLGRPFTIGWIGSPSTSRHMHLVLEALQQVCANGKARVVLVGSGPIDLPGVTMEIREWSEESEVADVQDFDIGIMPLCDEPFERGKCGYKLIQYMACGRAVIGSPVGVNRQIINHGVDGFLATSTAEWLSYLVALRDDSTLRKRLGEAGRAKVQQGYSVQVVAPRLIALLKEAAKGN